MKKRLKGVQIVLVVAISLFILAFPAYLRCTQLSQIKFVSSDLGFENPAQEDGVPDNEKKLKVCGPITLLIIFLLRTNPFELSFHFFLRALSLRQRIIVLRC